MLTPSDKELDRLSREAAEQYEPDENISSWEQLEARLDADLGKTPSAPSRRFGRGPIGYTAVVLLLAGASYLLFNRDKIHSNSSVRQNNNESVTKSKEAGGSNDEVAHPSTSSAEKQTSVDGVKAADKNNISPSTSRPTSSLGGHAKENKGVASPDDAKNAAPGNAKADEKPVPAGTTSGNRSIANQPDPSVPITNGGVNNAKAGRNKNSSAALAAGGGAAILAGSGTAAQGSGRHRRTQAGSTATSDLVQSQASNQLADDDITFKIATLPAVGKTGDKGNLANVPVNSFSSADLATPVSPFSHQQSKSLHLNRPLIIGIMYAPDITSVKGVAPDHLSSNFGLTLAYQITDRLSINSGFIATRKYYSANGKDFKTPPSWPMTSYLDFVKGDCYMYEIPLTLRYDFDAGKKTNFFVNGGFSSYLMTNQNYAYYGHYYTTGGRQDYATSKGYNGNENYLFSVISLSAGVEQQLGKGLSLQVEPFVKVPLTGMGVGSLNLSSYGLSFSLRYAPLLGKSRR